MIRRTQEDTPMTRLHGQVAVITGASAGMALAAARLFVIEGAHVYITGRRKDQLDDAVSEIGGNVTGVRSDSGDPRDLDLLVDAVRAGHGRVDVLYVSAGIGTVEEPLTAVTEDSFDTVFGVNVRGALFTVQKLLPLMSNGGSIILNGSAVWGRGIPGASVYAATKAALRSFARTWAAELAERGIRVNVLSPGPTDTAMIAGTPAEFREQIAALIPLKRLGQPADIAKAALFLASDDSSFVTGIDLAVDGGVAQI
jgi:NAD(P)-dependent dehydrogenase (short-subunit alcohol dehydrogenase family)